MKRYLHDGIPQEAQVGNDRRNAKWRFVYVDRNGYAFVMVKGKQMYLRGWSRME